MAKDKIRVRKSTKYFCIAVISVLFAVSFFVIFDFAFGNKKYVTNDKIYEYIDVFSHDYKVNLKDNKYILDKSLSMEKNAYVTNLIENIDLNLNYKFNADKESDIDYTYQIKGIIKGVYTKNDKEQEVIEREYILREPVTANVNNKKIDIKENLILDLKEKIILINDFEKEMGIAIDAVFNIVFEVKGNTVVEGKNIEFKKNHIISIGLDDKVTVINAEEAKEEVEKVYVKVEHEKEGSIVSVIISGIILILSIYAYIFVITRFKSVNKTKNEFKIEFNRIIKNCKEKLVQVDNLTDSNLQNIIFVKDFEELYKISEDVFKPILYWVSPRNNEVYFTIISDDTTYRFVLKR